MAPTPTTLFNHAVPEFFRSTTKPDERLALIRSLQNILGIISPAPIPVTGTYDIATEAAVNAFLKTKGLVPNGRTDDAFWGTLEGDAIGISPAAQPCNAVVGSHIGSFFSVCHKS